MHRRTLIIIIVGACLLRFVEARTSNLHYGKAFYNLAQGREGNNKPQALRFYQKAINFHPEQPKAYYSAGKIYHERGQFERATRYLQMATYLHPPYLRPGFEVAQNQLGLVYRQGGYYARAFQAFNEALRSHVAEYPPVASWYYKGATHLMLGEMEEALAALKPLEFLANYPRHSKVATPFFHKLRQLIKEYAAAP